MVKYTLPLVDIFSRCNHLFFSLKRGPVHLSTTMYHYAACFYTEGNLAFMIDPGRNNIRQDDGSQDEFGQRFKYK